MKGKSFLNGIRVSSTIPVFLILVPAYFLLGLALGFLQRLWVVALLGEENERFFSDFSVA